MTNADRLGETAQIVGFFVHVIIFSLGKGEKR